MFHEKFHEEWLDSAVKASQGWFTLGARKVAEIDSDGVFGKSPDPASEWTDRDGCGGVDWRCRRGPAARASGEDEVSGEKFCRCFGDGNCGCPLAGWWIFGRFVGEDFAENRRVAAKARTGGPVVVFFAEAKKSRCRPNWRHWRPSRGSGCSGK